LALHRRGDWVTGVVRLGGSDSDHDDGGSEDGGPGGGVQVMVGVLAGRLCKSQNPWPCTGGETGGRETRSEC
jgi:hypothetical protein